MKQIIMQINTWDTEIPHQLPWSLLLKLFYWLLNISRVTNHRADKFKDTIPDMWKIIILIEYI